MNQRECTLTGRVVVPAAPSYAEARQGFNRAIQQYPLIIVYCRSNRDVSNAVVWSQIHGVPLRVRNGGHNYEGYSNGNGTLVIDISEMNEMRLDERGRTLQVQAGATNGQIYQFAAARGYPFPGGTCPTVGISGYASGGGWGLSCRWLGLGCDSLEEIKLIDWTGCILTASPSCNPDLFWACRGTGGGNFGVMVSMTFRLPPRVDRVTLIEIDYLHSTTARQETFLKTWQSWLPGADFRMTLIARIYNDPEDGRAMLVRGIFYGSAQQAQALMQPFLDIPGVRARFEYTSFLEAVTILGGSYPPYEKFAAFSRYALREWTDSEISGLVGLIGEPAPGSVFAGLSLYALGGRVGETPRDETAFYYRDARFIVWLETIWEDPRYRRENRRWIHDRFAPLAQVTQGSYVNFPYRWLPDALEAYYGAHGTRLKQIKEKYDPCDVFTFPQGIGQGATSSGPWKEEETGGEEPPQQQGAVSRRRFRYV